MMNNCFKCLLLYWLWAQVFCIPLINAELDEDMWMEPDAWARDRLVAGAFHSTNSKCCRCSDTQVEHVNDGQPLQELKESMAEDVASSIYFKKFVTILFNRKNFKYDATKQHYKRSIVFTINSYQMDKLEQLQDPRDLDNILIEVFNNMNTRRTNCDSEEEIRGRDTSTAIKTIVFNILYDLGQLMKTSELRFFLVVICVILIAWFINKRLKTSWLLLISGGVLIYGYFHTYLECNRELEVNQMLDLLNSGTEHENNVRTSKFLNFFKRLFVDDDAKIRQQQQIKQSAKLSLGFCRPDHVFLMYFNDIFLKYLQMLIEQCAVTMTTLNGSLGFPYNLLSPVFVVCLVGYLIKLTFKYVLNPSSWFQLSHQNRLYHQSEKVLKTASNTEDDRISGDNLKLLLSAISAAPQQNGIVSTRQNTSVVSGVEDIREAIEPSSEKTLPKIDEGSSKTVQNNNVSHEIQTEEKIEVKKQELPES